MRVALFVPCYIEQFYPEVAIAALQILQKHGCEVDYPLNQTCCGQPMANSGFEKESHATMELFAENFAGYDYVVAPSGSCVLHVKEHYGRLEQTEKVKQVRTNIYELCEFLTEVLRVKSLPGRFPYKVGLHESCHGQRGLRLSQSTELNAPYYSKIKPLLQMIEGLELVELIRSDEMPWFWRKFLHWGRGYIYKNGKGQD